jgi:hypothetical protein
MTTQRARRTRARRLHCSGCTGADPDSVHKTLYRVYVRAGCWGNRTRVATDLGRALHCIGGKSATFTCARGVWSADATRDAPNRAALRGHVWWILRAVCLCLCLRRRRRRCRRIRRCRRCRCHRRRRHRHRRRPSPITKARIRRRRYNVCGWLNGPMQT